MHPNKTAIVTDTVSVTYAELNRKANVLAHKLRAQGVTRNTLVGIIAERSVEMLYAIFAVLKAGGAYVPIDPAYPEERIRYMLEDAEPLLILTNCDVGMQMIFELEISQD